MFSTVATATTSHGGRVTSVLDPKPRGMGREGQEGRGGVKIFWHFYGYF